MSAKTNISPRLRMVAESVLNSYAQLFFSGDRWFALLLMAATFLDPLTGLAGLFSASVALVSAWAFGLDAKILRSGAYSFNSLMTGLVTGIIYKPAFASFAVLALLSILVMGLSVVWLQFTAKRALPPLSFPFVAGVWMLALSVRALPGVALSERGIFTLNEMYSRGGDSLLGLYGYFQSLDLPELLLGYLRSLAAIFFQTNPVAGLLIAAGILIWSRIAFVLSVLGYFAGYLFFLASGADFSLLHYGFIGFNFILTAIALGGYFVIPSPASFLLAGIASLLTGLEVIAFSGWLAGWQLPVYSLPFCCTVFLVLLALRARVRTRHPEPVALQLFSPEKNLYYHQNLQDRFREQTWVQIHPPFFGEWAVSQGYDGSLTHRENYRHALDFVVMDEERKTWKWPGTDVSHFYCYNLPVLSPAAGQVVHLNDDVDDNPVGKVDTGHNWGNSIVIRHAEGIYSKISHIKRGSFRVKAGDFVRRGEMLATIGNSGRSPEPHIHFQVQATPHPASPTLAWPLAYYMVRTGSGMQFRSFSVPAEGEIITRVSTDANVRAAFTFEPGQILRFRDVHSGRISEWQVHVDASNLSFLYCAETESRAWFVNNETLFYFTGFSGDRSSLLGRFYLAAQKVLLGKYEQASISDRIPLNGIQSGLLNVLQDFISPFHVFLRAEYSSRGSREETADGNFWLLHSSVQVKAWGRVLDERKALMRLKDHALHSMRFEEAGKITEVICVN